MILTDFFVCLRQTDVIFTDFWVADVPFFTGFAGITGFLTYYWTFLFSPTAND
jgi:hypothetical protein